MIRPIPNTPALLLEFKKERILVVADLHLGIEGELETQGISLPSQANKTLKRLTELISKYRPKRLILLGDVKHGVPVASMHEWREIPSFLERLSRRVRVEIVPGNHDGDLAGMIPPGVRLHAARGIVLGKRKKIGLAHGHAWPAQEVFQTHTLVMAHNHPAIEFRDALGGRVIEPVWLKLNIRLERLPSEIRQNLRSSPPELIVMPAFGELVSGAPVNRVMPEELIGPLFKSGAADLQDAEVYMLDGTYLGKVKMLRKLLEKRPR